MRAAIRADRYQFAIDYRVVLYPFKRFRDFDVVVADDLAVAAVQVTFPPSILTTIRKPSYLSSNIQSLSSNGASVSVASIGCRCFGNVEVRAKVSRSVDSIALGRVRSSVVRMSLSVIKHAFWSS
jgi:hypothetical protein